MLIIRTPHGLQTGATNSFENCENASLVLICIKWREIQSYLLVFLLAATATTASVCLISG